MTINIPQGPARRAMQMVFKATDCSIVDMLSPLRNPRYAKPRHLAMWLTRHSGQCTYAQIGMAFNRDHTTVINGVQNVERRIAADPEYAAMANRLLAQAYPELADVVEMA